MTAALVLLALWNGAMLILWAAAALAIVDQQRTVTALTDRVDALAAHVQNTEGIAVNAQQVAHATARYAFTPVGTKAS